MARRAEVCASPIAPEQREHNELANSTQLPPRPDLEFNMKLSLATCLELSLEASSPASDQYAIPSLCWSLLLFIFLGECSFVKKKGATRQRGLELRLMRDLGKIWVSGFGPAEPAAASSTLR